MVVRGRLEPPIWALSAFADEEAAGTWLVNVTESTEADWPLTGVCVACVACASFWVDGIGAFDVEEGRGEELDEVALEVVVVELLELTKLALDVVEADETCGGASVS